MISQAFMTYMKDSMLMRNANDHLHYAVSLERPDFDFDVIGPYFTCPSTVETRDLHSIVTCTMLAFTQFGFPVRALLCDGASTNLSLLKLMCGYCHVF